MKIDFYFTCANLQRSSGDKWEKMEDRTWLRSISYKCLTTSQVSLPSLEILLSRLRTCSKQSSEIGVVIDTCSKTSKLFLICPFLRENLATSSTTARTISVLYFLWFSWRRNKLRRVLRFLSERPSNYCLIHFYKRYSRYISRRWWYQVVQRKFNPIYCW